MTWRLQGRSDELARGADALASSQLVAFTGAPGVGKSRLLAEVMGQFEASSRPVLRVLATEATRSVPLSPFAPLLTGSPPPNPTMLVAALVEAIEAADEHGGGGLLVAIDDAHHLDDASLALLGVIVANGTAHVALTTSNDHEPPAGLASLLRDDRSTILDIGPLSEADTTALAETVLGPVDPNLRDQLWRLSQGKPLVLREVLADAEGRLTQSDDGIWSADGSLIGGRLLDLARQRIAALDPDTGDALTVLAVGAPLPTDLLIEATSPDAVDRLLATSLAEADRRGNDRLTRPAHPLYGEVLRAGLGEGELGRIHRRLLEAATAVDATIDPLRVALWQHRSDGPRDPTIALAGVRAALGRQDGSLAATLLEPVADLIDPQLLALLHGASVMQQGRPEEAEAVFATGAAGLEAGTPLHAELASARAANLAFGLRRPAEADALLQRTAASSRDPLVQSRLEAERGTIAGITGDFAGALAAGRATVENPAATGATLATGYVSLTLAESMLGQLAAFHDHADAGVAAASTCAADLPLARDQIRVIQADACVIGGAIARATQIATSELAENRPLTRGLWLATLAYAHTFGGQLPAAEASATAALDRPELTDQFDLLGLALGSRAIARAQIGRPTDLTELADLRTQRDDPRNAVWLDRGRGWIHAAAGDTDAGAAMARAAGGHAIDGDHIGWGVLALHDAIRMGRGEEIAPIAAEISQAVATTEAAHLLEAMAAHAQALAREEVDALLAAATAFATAGSPLLAADAAAQAAHLADQAGAAVDAARAQAWAMAWLSWCPSAITPATVRCPTPLSARVLEIALDAATGQPSAAIATERYVSVRTVDNHLGTAYRTLGVSGRQELADVLGPVIPTGGTPRS